MLKSSLLEILRTFTKPELIKFEDFVQSPYFNKKENVVKLFFEIKKYAPVFANENLEKEKVWKSVFPGKEYNYGIMKNLIHDLTKLSESFITIEFTKDDKLENNINLLKTLLERKITKVFSSKIEMIEKIYDSPDLYNEGFSIDEYYDFLKKLYSLKSLYNRQYNIGSAAAYEFTCRTIDYLVYSEIISLYKYFNNYLSNNYKKILNNDNTAEIFLTGLNQNLIFPLLENVKGKSERDYLILKCFCDMNIAIYTGADIKSHFNFKKSLHDCLDIIPKKDLRDLLICLTNSLISIKRGNSGSGINFYKEILDNYDLMIENNIYLEENEIIAGNDFINYIMAAFSLKEFESIEIFAKKFGNKIPEDRRENDNNFSRALIFFGKKDYSKSLEYLSRINYDFFKMKHYVKDIQMMNYYELNDYESFSYVADSYKHFLSKNKSVTSYNKFVSDILYNSINKLFNLRESFDKYELEKFRKDIKDYTMMYKIWLLDKISELESIES
ncbi:MAG: hypothetical protein JSS91_02195 [Bacteroidetes bacterium]|nr:hypothetical protein [Bacteroidota bacterium]